MSNQNLFPYKYLFSCQNISEYICHIFLRYLKIIIDNSVFNFFWWFSFQTIFLLGYSLLDMLHPICQMSYSENSTNPEQREISAFLAVFTVVVLLILWCWLKFSFWVTKFIWILFTYTVTQYSLPYIYDFVIFSAQMYSYIFPLKLTFWFLFFPTCQDPPKSW